MMIYGLLDPEFITVAQLKLIKNWNQTNKPFIYRISSLAASSYIQPDQYALVAAVLNRGYEVETKW